MQFLDRQIFSLFEEKVVRDGGELDGLRGAMGAVSFRFLCFTVLPLVQPTVWVV
jgi:hypothetical protein